MLPPARFHTSSFVTCSTTVNTFLTVLTRSAWRRCQRCNNRPADCALSLSLSQAHRNLQFPSMSDSEFQNEDTEEDDVIAQLNDFEIRWRDRHDFLVSHGYRLRPRFRPGWRPSWWVDRSINVLHAEDHLFNIVSIRSFRFVGIVDTHTLR